MKRCFHPDVLMDTIKELPFTCFQVGTGGWLNQSRAEETQKGKTYRQRITNLSSNTEYDVRMAVWYNISVIYWPETPPKRFNTTGQSSHIGSLKYSCFAPSNVKILTYKRSHML